jgi:GT2 family glycosyltransferase
MNPMISFVMMSHNDSGMVINAIKSIKKLKTKYAYDIYVVDNGSRDKTPETIRKMFRDVKVIFLNKNTGTAGYDAAIKKSKSKYIYFTGCDIEAKDDMLDSLADFLENNNDAAQVAPKYLDLKDKKSVDIGGTWLSRSFYSGTFKSKILGESPIQIPYMGTGLIRKSFIDKWGYLFDNDYFFYGEDVDLGMRIRMTGLKVYYIPKSVVYHHGSTSRKIHKPFRLTFLMERNLMRTFYQTMQTKTIIKFKAYMIFMRLIAIAKDILTLNIGNALARIAAILWTALNIGRIMKKRSQVQKMRNTDDKEVLPHFSEKSLWKIS